MGNEHTVKDAIDLTGLEERQIMYRIRKGHVDARKVGWIWLISQKGIEQLRTIKNSNRKRLPNGAKEE